MDLEAEYNNRARVPEHGDIMADWARRAARHRDSAGGELDLAYGAHERQVCDIFRTRSDGGEAMAVFIHGGYWQALDKSLFSHMSLGLEVHGMAMCVPSYRLCPDVHVDDIIDDMRRLCLWLWQRHKRPLVVCGHSAGGHLAAAMVATDWSAHRAPDDLVRAGLGISGLYDLRPLIPTTINKALRLDESSAREASPLVWPSPSGRRFEAWVGGEESAEYHRQSASLAACWLGSGVHAKTVVESGANHFTVIQPLTDPASAMTNALADMCR
jgi:arylformamidase